MSFLNSDVWSSWQSCSRPVRMKERDGSTRSCNNSECTPYTIYNTNLNAQFVLQDQHLVHLLAVLNGDVDVVGDCLRLTCSSDEFLAAVKVSDTSSTQAFAYVIVWMALWRVLDQISEEQNVTRYALHWADEV